MRILVTGAKGFVGRNLVENLKNLKEGKNRTRPKLRVDEILEFDRQNSPEELEKFCGACDFVFHLAGVNRPKDPSEFRKGNFEFTSELLRALKKQKNLCPVLFSSSVQAALSGRFGTSEYGLSKKEGEELLFSYGEETGAKVYVYRFPNLAGKWARPDYNSAVATFCHNIANDLPITVRDPEAELELLFIDDLVEELFDALEGRPHRCIYPPEGAELGGTVYDGLTPYLLSGDEHGHRAYCCAPVTHKATLGSIAACLSSFHEQPKTLLMPRIAAGSFEKKLYSMYLSYLPKEKAVFDLDMKHDERGSFTELLKTADHGQFSVNISKPGITKGQHWHNSKWELFIVVSGHALIRERKTGADPETGLPYDPVEFEVSGKKLQAVHMLPGYTHSIQNLSDTENLITLMWADEIFDPARPDTFPEPV